jgi:riboflavin kinase / FMN adenylyltransferase
MQRIQLADVTSTLPAGVVTLGNFDGVHRGHQLLVQEALRCGRAAGCDVTVATFDPHPTRVLDPEQAPQALMTLAQKGEVLAALGVSRMVVIEFTRGLAALAPEEFASAILVQRLGARVVVAGVGFRFGRGRAGDVATLTSLGSGIGFRVSQVAPLVEGGQPVSSTRVRQALAAGDVEAARGLLGRPFATDGVVVSGDGRGRTLGIPTANVMRENEAIPTDGVYAAWCRLRQGAEAWGRAWPSVVSLGHRPTFSGDEHRIEAHLMGFSGNAYGATMRIEYRRRLRAEQRFPDAEALLAQVAVDMRQARVALGAE